MLVHWEQMSQEEYAAFQRSQGETIVSSGGVYWKRVRPGFYRPLLPFREFAPGALAPPLGARFGGCQHAVPPGAPANSSINLMMFQHPGAYSLEALERPKRKQVKSAAKDFTVRPLADLGEFKEKAYAVYLSFYNRTRYSYKAERRDPEGFARWAEALYQFPKLQILGAFREGELEAVSLSEFVEDTVIYSMVFPTDAGLRLNVSGLLLHLLREGAAADPRIKQMFVGMYKFRGRTGIDDYYLVRGCQLVSKPAWFSVNPLVGVLLRTCLRDQYAKLCGRLEPEMAAQAVRPTGSLGETKLAPLSDTGR